MKSRSKIPGRRYRVWVFLLLPLICSVGCRPGEPASVSGQCSFNGVPIEGGNIRFDPIEGAPGHGAAVKIRQGRYEIDASHGLYKGQYLVAISATRATGRQVAASETLDGGPSMIAEVVQFIPEKYNARSTVQVTLTPGANSHDFPLEP